LYVIHNLETKYFSGRPLRRKKLYKCVNSAYNTIIKNPEKGAVSIAGKIIITIGRQFGSGGREIGKQVAEKLGIPFYDKELLALAAEKSGMNPELFEHNDEQPINSLLYSLSVNPYAMNHIAGPAHMPIPQKLFLAQFDTIKSLAEKESCVFVGRCADYVLRDNPDCFNVFIHAPLEKRVECVKERMKLTEKEANNLILKTDKKRAAYYNSYSERKWGAADHYHLSFDSSRLSREKAVGLILYSIGES